MPQSKDQIARKDVETLADIFTERCKRTPRALAYRQYDSTSSAWVDFTWSETGKAVEQWKRALSHEEFVAGDRVAIMLNNCREWVIFDQAAHALGLVVVPLYMNDRAENIAYILNDAGVKLLLIDNQQQLQTLEQIDIALPELKRIVSLQELESGDKFAKQVISVKDWVAVTEKGLGETVAVDGESLATIVYTSGTTGKPKGVMLSHRNILSNAYSGLSMVDIFPDDLFLSFLPLSHMLERTIGYYLPVISGSAVAYNRSIPLLGADLLEIQPTIMISVPRIFERVYTKIQDKLATESAIKQKLFSLALETGWHTFECRQGRGKGGLKKLLNPLLDHLVGKKVRDKMGGRLRLTVCGGAPLSEGIAKFFIGLGIPILQGYGLTETSPVISVNTLEDNIPRSVGLPLSGIEVRIGDNDELLSRSESVMMGYWNNQDATDAMIDTDGWLHTGDKAKIEQGHIFITGRIKEIIVLANGEKVPPADIELAISLNTLIEQCLVVGEGKPYLSALVVLNLEEFQRHCQENGIPASNDGISQQPDAINLVSDIVRDALEKFPGYARIRQVQICDTPWSIENGLITPTLKIKRNEIQQRYQDLIDKMYAGH